MTRLDLAALDADQRRAVLAPEGPLLLVAGPGAGKTAVLVARISYLVTVRGLDPRAVLALAFTTAAARELLARLAAALGPRGAAVEATTFHAWGLRVVRAFAAELGYADRRLAVYGEADAGRLLAEVAGATDAGLAERPLGELRAALERARLADGAGLPVGDDKLAAVATAYAARLRARAAVDYPAMLAEPLRLFRARPEILAAVRAGYRAVVVDEGQDLCGAQWALLRLLCAGHRQLVLVGDPLQAIYGWRGADGSALRDFRSHYAEATVVALARNYRQSGRLVALANAVGDRLGDRHPLRTPNPDGPPPRLHAAAEPTAEAAFVADRLARLVADGALAGVGGAAVLYRAGGQAAELAAALRARHVPYRVRGHADVFARREVRDAVAYLRLAQSPADGPALARVVNAPPRRLGRLESALRAAPLPTDELVARAAPLGPAAREAAARLVALVDGLHAAAVAGVDPARLLDIALDASGYRAWLGEQAEGPARLENLARLRVLASRAEGGLGAWLTDLELDEDPAPTEDEAGRVVLATVHRAKGGEWRHVFLIGAEEGLLPHARALRPGGGPSPGLEAALAEEGRIAYVGLTRPREGLVVSYCRRRGDRPEPRRLSRFLRELAPGLLEPTG